MKTRNPIEKVVMLLPESGGPLLRAEVEIGNLCKNIEIQEAHLNDLHQSLRKARRALKIKVRTFYTDSEIETADVICTQRAGQRAPIRDFPQGGFTGQAVKNQP